MTFVEINNHLYEAEISGNLSDPDWNYRDTKAIHAVMTYEEALSNFTNNTPWSIHQTYEELENINPVTGEITPAPDPDIWDNSEYCLAGDITDHRDGTVTVKMGKLTELELVLAMM